MRSSNPISNLSCVGNVLWNWDLVSCQERARPPQNGDCDWYEDWMVVAPKKSPVSYWLPQLPSLHWLDLPGPQYKSSLFTRIPLEFKMRTLSSNQMISEFVRPNLDFLYKSLKPYQGNQWSWDSCAGQCKFCFSAVRDSKNEYLTAVVHCWHTLVHLTSQRVLGERFVKIWSTTYLRTDRVRY